MCLAAVMSLLVLPGRALEVLFLPGEYITEEGWGTLTIIRGQDGGLTFVIDTVGANAHTCDLEGDIRNGMTVLESNDEHTPCVVSFLPKGDDIEVNANHSDACRTYCGMRASFEGLYLKPAPGCDAKSRRETSDRFKRLYDDKAYAKARAVLEPMLKNCARTLDWIERGWLRNDLAVTLYHLGEAAACLNTLQPLAGDAAETDEAIRARYPPTDADNYLPIVQAARTNIKLCQKRAKQA